MPRLFLLLVLYGLSFLLVASENNWSTYQQRKVNYPEEVYFTGFVSQHFSKQDDLVDITDRLKEQAYARLSESIKISIESKITNKMTNINSTSLEQFEKISTSYSGVDLAGVESDTYINQRKKEAMGFAWIKKNKVITYYTQLIQEGYSSLLEISKLSDNLINSNKAKAFEILQTAVPIYRQVEEARAVLIVCGIDDRNVFMHEQISSLKAEIQGRIEQLKNARDLSMSELSAYLVEVIYSQAQFLEGTIRMENLTYRDSGLGSEFSFRLTALIKKDLANHGIEVSESVSLADNYVLKGTYWEHGTKDIEVLMTLYSIDEIGNERIKAGVEGWTTISVIQTSGYHYKPSNYFDAYEKKKLLSSYPDNSNGADVEIWTNKGNRGLVYQEGEKFRISIRSNKVGYLRLVNYWADGTKLLLEENYYIDISKVNRVIQLPLEWEVACPCGAEYLHASINAEMFQPLNTRDEDGFTFIIDDFEQVVDLSRISTGASNESYVTEDMVSFTTIKR